jgi:predicted Fe-Mo cluster-binding NifX family protein
MRIAVSANGADLGAQASPVFGRCPVYVFVDTETSASEAMENPAISAPGGAGIQAAQFVVEQGAQAVVTGNVGPNAYNVLQAAGVAVYLFQGGTVAEAVEAFRAGQLQEVSGATSPQHAGLGQGRGGGRGGAMRLRQSTAEPASPHDREVAALQETVVALRRQLAEVMERLEQLEKER